MQGAWFRWVMVTMETTGHEAGWVGCRWRRAVTAVAPAARPCLFQAFWGSLCKLHEVHRPKWIAPQLNILWMNAFGTGLNLH